MTPETVATRTYAGVLGKIAGVYLGRPVEGWSYESIRERFGEVSHYVAAETGAPLIVPDDDISGTFVLSRALEDHLDALDEHGVAPSAAVGATWLNYIVEDRTVLWWGGLSRSTEHTVYLRLKNGTPPPASGSTELNGASMSEQIGAEIFIDGWGLLNPGDPERAIRMARNAARVSHDGVAVSAASLLAGLEALAFVERDVDALLDACLPLVPDPRLHALVDEVRALCAGVSHWREARDWIEERHGYDRYPSNSPVQTNHLAVLMSLLLGGDDWQRSLEICVSAGWDTDSNAGNVGCLNGIRLGLGGFETGADLRGPVADRLYAVSADGGEVVTDAVRETRRILAASAASRGEPTPEPRPRFAFDLPGAVQGFRAHPEPAGWQALTAVEGTGAGLRVAYRALARGTRAAVATDTFCEPQPRGVAGTSYFEVVASPTLYPGQTVTATLGEVEGEAPDARLFVDVFDEDGAVRTLRGPREAVEAGSELRWEVPDTNGDPVFRVGLELLSETRRDGAVVLRSMDFGGAPRRYRLGRSYELTPALTPWTTDTVWLRTFVSSAKNLAPDYTTTMCVSHPEPGGVVTTGTRDWADYTVTSRIEFNRSEGAGLVARARGHRRYYALVLRGGGETARLSLEREWDGERTVLASCPVIHEIDERHVVALTVRGPELEAAFDGVAVLSARDDRIRSGGAGFVVHAGAFLADGFAVEAAR